MESWFMRIRCWFSGHFFTRLQNRIKLIEKTRNGNFVQLHSILWLKTFFGGLENWLEWLSSPSQPHTLSLFLLMKISVNPIFIIIVLLILLFVPSSGEFYISVLQTSYIGWSAPGEVSPRYTQQCWVLLNY